MLMLPLLSPLGREEVLNETERLAGVVPVAELSVIQLADGVAVNVCDELSLADKYIACEGRVAPVPPV
jgi:hypothetical protein